MWNINGIAVDRTNSRKVLLGRWLRGEFCDDRDELVYLGKLSMYGRFPFSRKWAMLKKCE